MSLFYYNFCVGSKIKFLSKRLTVPCLVTLGFENIHIRNRAKLFCKLNYCPN